MGRKHYPKVLREQIIEEVRRGRSVAAVSRDYEPCEHTIHRWMLSVKEQGIDSVTDEEAALLAENARLRRDLEILKKATAWFAQENQEDQ